VKGTPRLGTA